VQASGKHLLITSGIEENGDYGNCEFLSTSSPVVGTGTT
jgi:hypothetical protein